MTVTSQDLSQVGRNLRGSFLPASKVPAQLHGRDNDDDDDDQEGRRTAMEAVSSSNDLYDFLTEIGAASIQPKVSIPTKAQPPPLQRIHNRINQEISSIDDQTRRLLTDNWPEFHRQVNQGQELLALLDQEERELEELESHLTGQAAFLPSLLSQLTSHSQLADSYSKTETSILLFSSLLSYHERIASLSSLISAGSLPSALHHLSEIAVAPVPDNWITETDSWRSLKKWFGEEELRLESSIIGALEACFDFSGEIGKDVKFVMRDRIRAAPRGELLTVPVLFDLLEKALEGKKRERKLEKQLERIAKQLLKYFIAPFLMKNGTMGSTMEEGRLEWKYDMDERDGAKVQTVRLSSSPSSRASKPESPLPALETFLSFLRRQSSLLPPSPYSKTFTTHLTPPIQSLIITSHLSPSLPQSISLLSDYISLLDLAKSFEQYLVSDGYLDFLPSESEENVVIRSWIEGVNGHWAKEVANRSLEKCREMVMNMGEWEGEKVTIKVEIEVEPEPEPEPPSPPPVPKQKKVLSPPPPAPEPEPTPTPPVKRGRQALGTRITTPLPPNSLPPISPSLLESETFATSPSLQTRTLSRDTARPLSTASNYSQSTVMPMSPEPDLESMTEEGDEDPWGLAAGTGPGEENGRKRAGSISSSSGSIGEDAWGFGEEDAPPTSTKATLAPVDGPAKTLSLKASTSSLHPDSAGSGAGGGRKRSGSVGSQLSVASSTGEDAWGFGDDEGMVADEEDVDGDGDVVEYEGEKKDDAEEAEHEGDTTITEDETPIESVQAEETRTEPPVPPATLESSSGGEDGWGFSGDEKGSSVGDAPVEEEPVPSTVAEEKVESSEGEGEGAWGFDDEVVASDSEVASMPTAIPTPAPRPLSPPLQRIASPALAAARTTSNLSPGTTPTLNSTATPTLKSTTATPPVISTATPTLKPKPKVAAESHPPPVVKSIVKSHAKKESGGWSWEEDEEEEDADTRGRREKRESMRNGLGNGAPPPPPRPQYRDEYLTISKKSKVITKIAEEILVNALEVGSPSFEHKTFASASGPLLRSYISVLSLYRATTPVYHSKLLLSVPALGMQFANDAQWISDEVEKSWNTLGKGKAKEEDADRVVHAVNAMRLFSARWREQQIAIQRKALSDCLDEADGFVYTESDVRFATCERALKELTYTLERLAQAWKPIINSTLLYSTLGSLVNEVLTRVLTEIESHADISEEESIRLNQLCKMLHGLEALFEGGTSSVGREVPIWFKFQFLTDFLEGSMADVLFLFDDGHLVDFSTSEISKLVRALFSDSPLRQKNLEHIARGHPERIPSGDSSDAEIGYSP